MKDTSYKRTLARLMAVQALYAQAMDPSKPAPESPEDISPQEAQYFEAMAHGLGEKDRTLAKAELKETDRGLFRKIVCGVPAIEEQLTKRIEENLADNWKLSRIPPLSLAILRAALYECYAESKVPLPVIISDYVNIADLLLEPGDTKWVHAVIDKAGKKIRG